KAQSFKADVSEVKQIAIATRGENVAGTFLGTLEPDAGGLPSGKALATAEFAPLSGDGVTVVPLTAVLEPQKTYWVCIKPKDTASRGLAIGISEKDSFPDGQLIPYEIFGDYFQGWRPYDGEALRFEGRSTWRVSYEERRAWEKSIRATRASTR
ncbi:MAG: hypothetical protein HY318_10625, partial [Armatimonadetes bacterium]|nr:hypothetical protein [Armatimonadota bacterium]